MLYKLVKATGQPNSLEPLEFIEVNIEKHLENLLADSLFEVLYEEARLLPIHQEERGQPVADIYALNEKGELIIFELKRGPVGDAAVLQALRYAQDAGKWTYTDIEEKFKAYSKQHRQLISNYDKLTEAHKEAFNLNLALNEWDFNKKQHLIIIGSASDEALINAIAYWKEQGLSIEFLPYRIYSIGDEQYFEFFALPFDRHSNPGARKGVLFDTNRSYDKNSIWDMMENKRVAAYGGSRGWVSVLNPNDIVFFYHTGRGIVAAAIVKGTLQKPNDTDEKGEWYYNVKFLTSVPVKVSFQNIKAMPAAKVVEFIGHNFFWARIAKVPYLSKVEADNLVEELKKYI
ncbi:MAG: hypothetical protein ACLPVO_12535 [Desulfomonilaceae bacterium]